MADEAIDSYVDRAGVAGDTEFIVASLRQVYTEFKNIEGIKVDFKGLTGITAIAPALKQAAAGADSLDAATQTVTERIAKMNGQSKEFTNVLLQQTKAQKEAAAATLLQAKADNERIKLSGAKKKAAVDEEKATKDLNNAYKQLSLAYNDAALKAKNLQLELGKNHPIAVQATADANAMGAKLKELDASTGTFNRNVGNYGGALVEYGKKAFGFIRVAANILPGLGLSGAFLLIFEGLDKVFSLFSTGLSNAEKQARRFNEVNTKAVEIYAEQKTQIEEYVKKIKDANTSDQERKEILKDVNDKYGDQIGHLTDINQLETVFVAHSQVLIKSIELRAKAQAAFALATEASKKQLVGQLVIEEAQRKLANASDLVRNNVLAQIQKQIKDADKDFNGFIKLYEKFSAEAANLNVKAPGLDLGLAAGGAAKSGKKDKKSTADDAKKLADEQLKAQTEMQALLIQRQIDYNKAIADDESRSYLDRLFALRTYIKLSGDLIDLRAETEKKLGKKTAIEIQAIAEGQYNAQLNLQRDFTKQRQKIEDDFNKQRSEDEKRVQKNLEDGIKDRVKSELAALKEITDANKKAGKEIADNEDKLRAEKKKLEQQLANELTSLAFTVLTANIERQKNAIQEQIDALDVKKQKEIEVANATLANTQERADAIAIIEARAAAQKELLQKKQRDFDIKKAKFDKAESIARIIQETAIQISANLGKPILLPLIIALGAAQLASVLATPIPKYKHGKNLSDAYAGPAWVDDGGKPEAIIRESGAIEVGGNKPRLTYLGKRDIVLPDANQLVDYVLAGHMGGHIMTRGEAKTDNSVAHAVGRLERNLVKAIQSKKELHLNASQGGLAAMWKWGANQTKYINDQTNW